ncbi:MAG TPA: hypothetical protein PKW80_16095 [Bacteroidales bacterium]|nr:hypothetical protein [Bacteroidales bacterium]
MKTKILMLALICTCTACPLLAQELTEADNRTLAEKIEKKETFGNFPEVLKKFRDVTLPLTSASDELTKAPEWLIGKFSIGKTYVGLLVGTSVSVSLYIYDRKGNFSDEVLIYDYWDDYGYSDYYSVVGFTLSKALVLDITCDGYDCEGYPLKLNPNLDINTY